MVSSDNPSSERQNVQISTAKKSSASKGFNVSKIKAAVISPDNKSVQASEELFLGAKFEMENSLEQAIECYLRAVSLSPRYVQGRQKLVQALKKAERYREAKLHEDLLDKLKSGSVNSATKVSSISVAKPSSDHELAVAPPQLELKASSPQPKPGDSEVGSGVILPDSDKLHLKGYLEQPDMRVARAYLEQAQSLYDERRWEEAIKVCRKALIACSTLALAYKVWGNCLQKQGNTSEAFGKYAKALEIDPNLAEVYANIGSLLAMKKRWHESLRYFKQSLAIDPHLASTYRNLATVWEELGNQEKSEECFFRAVELKPETLNVKQYLSLAEEFLLEDSTERAIACCRLGIKVAPECQEIYLKLIEILEENEQWREANHCYKKLLELKEQEISGEDISNGKTTRMRRLLVPEKSPNSVRISALPPARETTKINQKKNISVSKIKKKRSVLK